MTRYDTSLTPQRAAMSTAASIATPRVSLRIGSGAHALRAAPVAPRGAHRGASVPVRAIGGKKGASDGKKAAAKSVGKEKKSSGKTGTAIGESPLSNLPVPLPVAGGGVLVVGVVLAKILGGRRGGSVASLEERGALDENRYVDDDKFFSGMMKTVRTVEMPTLTEAQVRAARERRRQSRDIDASPSTLENVELPANHPFATDAKVSEAERKKLAERVREMNKPRRRRGRGAPPGDE
jgi:hypothetical protein